MNDINTDHVKKVVKFAQEFLFDEEDRTAITSDLISEKIDLVLRINPKWSEGLNILQKNYIFCQGDHKCLL